VTRLTPYCFHCELKSILDRNIKLGAVDQEEALHSFARCLGEIIAECPSYAVAIEDARRWVVHYASQNIETATKTRH